METLPKSPDPNRPYVVMMSAVTLDGKLTVSRGVTSGSLGPFVTMEVVEFLHKMRASVDAVMVGGNTIIIDNPSLTVRAVEGSSPTRVVVDPEGAVPLESKVFHDGAAPTIVAVAGETPESRLSALRELNVQVISAGSGKFVDIKELMKGLVSTGIKSLLIEGGATLNWLSISAGLVDDYQIIKVPIVTGVKSSPAFVEAPAGIETGKPVQLECYDIQRVGNCVVLCSRFVT